MSVALVVFGYVGYTRLPVRELPDIEFPIVSVSTVLPGASPEVVETEITEVLEEELNGIEGIDIIQSMSTEQVSTITLQFLLSRNIDTAAEDVRDRVARVRNRLPEDAEEPRVAKFDVSAETIMWVALFSDTRSPFELVELADKFVKPKFETVPGVGRVRAGGSNQEAMRIELDRQLLATYGLTVADVVSALRSQNVEVPSGRVEGASREFVVRTRGEFETTAGFKSLIVAYKGGSPVRLGDVASVRRGFDNERTRAVFNGTLTVGLGIVKQSQANTVAVAAGIKSEIEKLRPQLPDGFRIQVAFDQSPFIEQSIREVRQSLLIACALVIVVIFVFLQSVRSTLIPSVVMPVALLSTFGFIYFLGFTINNLVLMALTLVVGVVVDDAIIVLENVYRHMELGKSRLEAAVAASDEIAFAVISTTLTLIAVFVPIAFLGGTVGRFFFEFGISVVVAVSVSSFVALTLTPMLCSRFLNVGTTAQQKGVFGSTARSFDRGLERMTAGYVRTLRLALRHRVWMVVIIVATVVASGLLFANAGKEFIPQDDRGYFMVSVKTPEGSTMAYQDRHQRRVEKLLDDTPEVRSYFSILAIGRGGPGKVNDGIMFVRMEPWGVRKRGIPAVLSELRGKASYIAGADVFFFQFNPLQRGSGSKPFSFVIQHNDLDELSDYSRQLLDIASGMPEFRDVDIDLEVNKPQLNVTISREKASALGISVIDIADTLKVMLGGDNVSTFKRGNDRYDVIVQLAAAHRVEPGDLERIYVRTGGGELVPLSNVVQVREAVGPSAVSHYGRKRSVVLDANLDGTDLGTAIDTLSEIAGSILPEGFTTTLSGQSREHARSSQGLAFTFILAIVSIYLVLAAQFESFVHPFTIMLALPLATFGALAGISMFSMNLSVYAYIGLIMLMGLVTKNSILLVDYINILRERGVETREAIIEAGKTRLRPILMTAVSTIFGILPIAIGFGTGAEGRRPLGVAVVAGLTTSTVLTLIIVPIVYSMLDDLMPGLRAHRHARREARKAAIAAQSET
jgi:hydrophobe/amphiphile efflux-1 (HAE1) family protein